MLYSMHTTALLCRINSHRAVALNFYRRVINTTFARNRKTERRRPQWRGLCVSLTCARVMFLSKTGIRLTVVAHGVWSVAKPPTPVAS